MDRSNYSVLSTLVMSLLALWLVTPRMQAQEARGQILGRVTDPSGAVVVGAHVSTINAATNVETATTTNETGDYVLPLLIPGTYNVSVEMTGFRKSVQDGVPVRVADRIALNVSLQLGDTTQSVQVLAKVSLLDTESASMGSVVDRRQIAELPLKDGNPMMLSVLAPGVMSLVSGGWSRPFDNGQFTNLQVNGVRTGTAEFTIDGAPNTEHYEKTVAYVPPTEAVQEFKIQTSTFDASMGFSPSAVVNVSLKSGTNEVHGAAWGFIQNTALDANDFFNNRNNLKKTPGNLGRWGTTIGGPLWLGKLYNGKNKVFWTYTYEGIHDYTKETAYSSAVPTPDERKGDFSALTALGAQYAIYDPASTVPATGGLFRRTPFEGNKIPPSRINSTGSKIANLYDPPNQTGPADGSNNWYTPGPIYDWFYSHLFRMDYNLSSKNRFFIRGNANRRGDIYNKWFNGTMGQRGFRNNKGLGVDDVHVFSPVFLMNVRYSLTNYNVWYNPVTVGYDLASLDFSSAFLDQINQIDSTAMKFPSIAISGYQSMGTDTKSDRHDYTQNLAANFTWIVHSHTLHFGSDVRIYQENYTSLGQSSGSFTFNSSWTNGPLSSAAASPIGQGLAALLLGLPATSSSIPKNDSYAEQSGFLAGFIQDDWKLSNKLTLNLGLRYELEFPTTERFNRTVAGFDYSSPSPIASTAEANYAANPISQVPADQFKVRGGLLFAGVNGQPRDLWRTVKNEFAPRLGLAYTVTPTTVIRTGYGIFFDQLGINRNTVNQTGFSSTTNFVGTIDNGQTFFTNLSNPFPGGITQPTGARAGLGTYMGQSVSFFNPDLRTPYMQRWQFSIQRQLPHQMVAELAYVGNRGENLLVSRQLDAVPAQYLSTSPLRDQTTINTLTGQVNNPFYPLLPGTGLSGTTVSRSQLLMAYPQFTGVSMQNNAGYSYYHALQAHFQKRLEKGFSAELSWTWAKFMEATSYLNATDVDPALVVSDQDRTMRLVANAVWELPFGRGRKWGSSVNGAANKIIGGWQTQAIYQVQGGPPIGFSNFLLVPGKLLQDIPLSGSERTVDRWFNTSAIVTASGQQLANNIIDKSVRFSGIRGPGRNNWDISMVKNTDITERVRLQFRSEFINALNHPQFNNPNTTPTNTSFGRLTTANQWPRVIQFGLKLLF